VFIEMKCRLYYKRFFAAIAIVSVCYLGSFRLLMNTHSVAIDANEQIVFKSAFRFARVNTTMKNGHTETYILVSPSTIFMPLSILFITGSDRLTITR
jgi:hypothetical protein